MALTLIEPLYTLLQDVWQEASTRQGVDEDALMGLWKRLEKMHVEAGECLRENLWNLDSARSGLIALRSRARAELERVRAGELDAV